MVNFEKFWLLKCKIPRIAISDRIHIPKLQYRLRFEIDWHYSVKQWLSLIWLLDSLDNYGFLYFWFVLPWINITSSTDFIKFLLKCSLRQFPVSCHVEKKNLRCAEKKTTFLWWSHIPTALESSYGWSVLMKFEHEFALCLPNFVKRPSP